MRHLLLLALLGAPLAAADAPPVAGGKPATTPAPKAGEPKPAPAPAPFLGVRFDENSVSMDSEPGMPVSEVVAGSTAQGLGLEGGDRLLSINGKPVEKTEDIKAVLAGSKVGDPVELAFSHDGKKTTAKGQLQERPKPAALAREVDKLNQKLAEVRDLAQAKAREPSLGEILQQLKDIESGLPRAVAAFKQQYPDGDFDIRIQVSITSDKHAKNPIEFSNAQAAPEGTKPATEDKPAEAKATEGKPAEAKPADKPSPAEPKAK